jgi:putative peptidoglycan lipid II flippase
VRVTGSEANEIGLVRAVGAIGAATLASRVLGFVRDMVIARAFGAGPTTDAFFVAFRIPNLLRRLLAEGALSTAFIPVLSEFLAHRSRDEFNRMLRAVAGALLAALCAVTLLGILLAPWLVRVMAPGFAADPEQVRLATGLTQLMFPYLILVGLAALAMGVLNAHRRFFTGALAPAVLNVGMILSVLLLAGRLPVPILSLAVGVLAGGLGQLLIQIPEIRQSGAALAPSAEFSHPAVRRIAWLLGPSVFGLAALQLSVFVTTFLASLLPQGSISFLYYADRVMEFPLGVFGIAVATAALPFMGEQAVRRDLAGLSETLNFALRLSCFVAIPASVGLIILRVPITRVLFERGQFGPLETEATAFALGLYALGLPAFAGARILAQVFYALGDTRTPVRVGIGAVGLNVLLALAFMGPLSHGGLALAASCASAANLAGLLWLLRRQLGPMGGGRIVRSLGLVGVATSLMAIWCVLLLQWWPAPILSPGARWIEAGWLLVAIVGGAGVYAGIGASLGSQEWTALRALASRRRQRAHRESLPPGEGR